MEGMIVMNLVNSNSTANVYQVKRVLDPVYKELVANGNTRSFITAKLKQSVYQLGKKLGYNVEENYRVYFENKDGDTIQGRADIAWYDENGEVVLVIEVDNSIRERSIRKLNNCTKGERPCLWVYYGKKLTQAKEAIEAIDTDDEINVIWLQV